MTDKPMTVAEAMAREVQYTAMRETMNEAYDQAIAEMLTKPAARREQKEGGE